MSTRFPLQPLMHATQSLRPVIVLQVPIGLFGILCGVTSRRHSPALGCRSTQTLLLPMKNGIGSCGGQYGPSLVLLEFLQWVGVGRSADDTMVPFNWYLIPAEASPWYPVDGKCVLEGGENLSQHIDALQETDWLPFDIA